MNLESLGVTIVHDFVTKDQESIIKSLVNEHKGASRASLNAPSRMLRFGKLNLTTGLLNDEKGKSQGYNNPRRSYGAMNDGIDVAVESIPGVLNAIGAKLVNLKFQTHQPELYVINVYNKGCRILRHIDHDDNGPIIPVVGLMLDATMVLTHKTKGRIEFTFPRRSLVVLSGESRYEWFHELLPVNEERLSIVVRNVGLNNG